MDSPATRYGLDSTGFAESDTSESEATRRNWEGLLAALGISALGWATLALLITLLLR